MKRINFKEVSVETSIDKFEVMDLSREVGNAIYKKAQNVPMSDLARKVYHSDGPIEIEDQDCKEMLQVVETSFVRYAYVAIMNAIESVNKDLNNN